MKLLSFFPASIRTTLPLIALVSALGLTALQSGYSALPEVIVNGRLTKEALFDERISAEKLAEEIQAAGLDVPTAVTQAVRMTPGEHFTAVGQIGSFDYFPEAYSGRHAVNYYIPRSLKAGLYGKSADVAPVLVLWHGGGPNSTDTYEGAKRTALNYLSTFIHFAETSGTILIAPSTQRWNAHSCSFLTREVNALARKELNVSGNRFYLFGHSMGAMGITRAAGNLADEFAGFLAAAGGMAKSMQTEQNLRPYLNTRFTHINGERDTFVSFKPLLRGTEKKLQELSAREGMPLHFQAVLHPGGHEFDLSLTQAKLLELFAEPRDLDQSRLFAQMGRGFLPPVSLLPQIKDFSYPHFFWAKATKLAHPPEGRGSAYSSWNFALDPAANSIVLTPHTDSENLEAVDLFVSRRTLDLSKPVKVMLGTTQLLETMVEPNAAKTIEIVRDRGDAQFAFDNVIHAKLTQDEVVEPTPVRKKPTVRKKKKRRFRIF